MNTLQKIFLIAFGGGIVGTFVARLFALRMGFMSRPNPIVKQHRRAVAYLGGAGVFLGYFAVVGASPLTTIYVLPAFLFLLIGIFDDLKAFEAGPKFLLQLGVALLAVRLGNRIAVTGHPAADVLISAFCILTMVNAYNFIDVCDGLAGGIGAIAFGALALSGAAGTTHPLAACGAALGFLIFNLPPARIFLGDAGSHLMGFLIAAFSISLFNDAPSWPRAGEVLLISGVPLFELVFITAIRLRKRIPWWRGSPDHFALRLQAAGLNRLQTDLCGWLAAGLMGAFGISLESMSQTETAACLAILGLTLAISVFFLLRWDVRPGHEYPPLRNKRPTIP